MKQTYVKFVSLRVPVQRLRLNLVVEKNKFVGLKEVNILTARFRPSCFFQCIILTDELSD